MTRWFQISVIFSFLNVSAQSDTKDYFPIWSFTQDSARIHGISFGFLTDNVDAGQTLTNGLRLELLGLGFLLPLFPASTIARSDEEFHDVMNRVRKQNVNGVNLCTKGTVGDCAVNGMSCGGIGQSLVEVNGVTLSTMMNLVQKQNGLMMSMFNDAFVMHGGQLGLSNNAYHCSGLQCAALNNYAHITHGLQIGLFNKAETLHGVQVGLWNVNQKRKLPLLNWCFRGDANDK
jgi:hypothetical protein